MSDEPPLQAGDAGDRRVQQLLLELRSGAPTPPEQLVERVVRRARWERGVRHTGDTLGGFGGTLLEGMAILLGVMKARR